MTKATPIKLISEKFDLKNHVFKVPAKKKLKYVAPCSGYYDVGEKELKLLSHKEAKEYFNEPRPKTNKGK